MGEYRRVVWSCCILVLSACFDGDFAQGLPCQSNEDCGPRLSCIDGLCGGPGSRDLCGNGLIDAGEECDGELTVNGPCTEDCRIPAMLPTPLEFETIVASPIKHLDFTWTESQYATTYTLMSQAKPEAPFEEALPPTSMTSASLTVPLHLQPGVRYRVRACNAAGCVDSPSVLATDEVGTMRDAIGYFKASNTSQRFGLATELSRDGRTLAVGGPHENGASTGINGDDSDLSGYLSGAAYVFAQDSRGAWSQQAYIKSSHYGGEDFFALSVALSADGNTLAVGAPSEDGGTAGIGGDQSDDTRANSGAAYIFVRDAMGMWSEHAYIKASNPGANDDFGRIVDLSDDGNTLVVGAWNEGSDATGIDGDGLNDLAPFSGAVYVFVRDPMTQVWSQQAYVKASNTGAEDHFGGPYLGLSGDGNTLAVGASGEDGDAVGIGGAQDNDAADDAGALYMFVRDPTTQVWSQQAYIKASNTGAGDWFGRSSALSYDGDTLVVGASQEDSDAAGIDDDQTNDAAPNAGAVYVYGRDDMGEWTQRAYIKASNSSEGDAFGEHVALSSSGDLLAVGALNEDGDGVGVATAPNDFGYNAGAVYVFERDAMGEWTERSYLKASNADDDDELRWVSLSGDGRVLAVGSQREESNATGIGGNQGDDSLPSGAVYLF